MQIWERFYDTLYVIFVCSSVTLFGATKRVAWVTFWTCQWWLWTFLWLFYLFQFNCKLIWKFEMQIMVFQKPGFFTPEFEINNSSKSIKLHLFDQFNTNHTNKLMETQAIQCIHEKATIKWHKHRHKTKQNDQSIFSKTKPKIIKLNNSSIFHNKTQKNHSKPNKTKTKAHPIYIFLFLLSSFCFCLLCFLITCVWHLKPNKQKQNINKKKSPKSKKKKITFFAAICWRL